MNEINREKLAWEVMEGWLFEFSNCVMTPVMRKH